jgi:hypothetical protein
MRQVAETERDTGQRRDTNQEETGNRKRRRRCSMAFNREKKRLVRKR